jgi:hypothetical protein
VCFPQEASTPRSSVCRAQSCGHGFTKTAADCRLTLDLACSELLKVEEVPERVKQIPLLVFVPSGEAHPPSLDDLQRLNEESPRSVQPR